MKETDWRNTLEVIVKGLVAVVVALAGLYVLGWILSFLGGLLLGLAGIIVALLRWLVPVALIVGIVYFAVTQLQPKGISAAKPAKKAEEGNLETVLKPEPVAQETEAAAAEPEAPASQASADSDEKKPIPEA
jgi:predicted lipid-binding transport protein (Tim44 family)